jgi:hypothetical protein
VQRLVGGVAERFILFLCFLFGRRVDLGELPWLDGPIGPRKIGADFHHLLASAAGLVVRQCRRHLLDSLRQLADEGGKPFQAPKAIGAQ